MSRVNIVSRDWFFEHVNVTPDCWIWNGPRTTLGYGRPRILGRKTLAHRISWEIFRGTIPEGLGVLHRCDNPLCVNPDHLEIGDQKKNMMDATARGRLDSQKHPEKYNGEKSNFARLTVEQVRAVKEALLTKRQCDVAREFGLSKQIVFEIKSGKSWRHV